MAVTYARLFSLRDDFFYLNNGRWVRLKNMQLAKKSKPEKGFSASSASFTFVPTSSLAFFCLGRVMTFLNAHVQQKNNGLVSVLTWIEEVKFCDQITLVIL